MGRIQKIEAVINTASGSVGANAPAEAEKVFAELGLPATIHVPEPGNLPEVLQKAMDASPDLLVVVAGDGTARAAAELCGLTGPLVAPLPGGTMNMLPGALYGTLKWAEALSAILVDGEERTIGAGSLDGKAFYVAAILGEPALFALAREAARKGKPVEAFRRARYALGRAFGGRLRYQLEGGPRAKAEALSLICPLISKALPDDAPALEAAVLSPQGARDVFRLAFSAMASDWRRDPSVEVTRCREGQAWASNGIPAILDGEPTRLGGAARFRFHPEAVRVLVPKEAG